LKNIREISAAAAVKIKYALCDIDGTLTTDGKLTKEAFGALWDLSRAGINVIPVTGRPAGWCDLIARQWPVAAVVGENGAFAMYLKEGLLTVMRHREAASDAGSRLEALREKVLSRIPQARVAGDQFCRWYDIAFDFAETPPYLGMDTARQIRDICISQGAQAKISSIHVNAWYGNYDKLGMSLLCLNELFNEPSPKESVVFFGDSPNDEPMFEYFPISVGVANIADFTDMLEYPPAYVTKERDGGGFAEAAGILLKAAGH